MGLIPPFRRGGAPASVASSSEDNQGGVVPLERERDCADSLPEKKHKEDNAISTPQGNDQPPTWGGRTSPPLYGRRKKPGSPYLVFTSWPAGTKEGSRPFHRKTVGLFMRGEGGGIIVAGPLQHPEPR